MNYSPFTNRKTFDINVTAGSGSFSSQLLYTLSVDALVVSYDTSYTNLSASESVSTNLDSNPVNWDNMVWEKSIDSRLMISTRFFKAGTSIYALVRGAGGSAQTLTGKLLVLELD